MKLYYIAASCSLSPHIVANELGLDLTLVRVNPKTRQTADGEDYDGINPLGSVPMLELDDGTRLREGTVIVQYLAELKPERDLTPPPGTLARYRLNEWLAFLSSEIHKGFIPLLYATLAGRYVETAGPKLRRRFEWIDAQLSGGAWLMGERFTVADAYLFALIGWAQAPWLTTYVKTDLQLNDLDHLATWYARMKQRPAVLNALTAEGLTH